MKCGGVLVDSSVRNLESLQQFNVRNSLFFEISKPHRQLVDSTLGIVELFGKIDSLGFNGVELVCHAERFIFSASNIVFDVVYRLL